MIHQHEEGRQPARTVIGINTSYQTWPSFEHLDKLLYEVRKARDEIDTRWRSVANEEEVWLDGLASAATGRPLSGMTSEQVAQHLKDWATSITWPTCVPTLQPTDIQRLYPTSGEQGCADIAQILKRTLYGSEDWRRELVEILARQFGVQGWTKIEVERAVARISIALKSAANLDAFLRKHVLGRLAQIFAPNAEVSPALGDLLKQWRADHDIPEDNDLSDEAHILLRQIDDSADAETTLLVTLPRALPQVALSYQQWRSYADLDRYVQVVAVAVSEVNAYVPLATAEVAWLTGMVTNVLRRPLTTPSRERSRLSHAVAQQLITWLREQNLPTFTATLTADDLQELFADETPEQHEAVLVVIRSADALTADPASFLLTVLPSTLGVTSAGSTWSDEDVAALLDRFQRICWCVGGLNSAASQWLLSAIGRVFGVDANGGGASALVAKLHEWRKAYVLFANETLSPDAAIVSEALSASADDPVGLLLTTLPNKLNNVRTPYRSWRSWEDRRVYLDALAAAAHEIEQIGGIGDATPRVRELWDTVKTQIISLSRDEQRWLIKAFNEEFRG